MAKPTSQWAYITILALMASTFTTAHEVKPYARTTRSRKLQMDTHGESETTNFQASDSDGKSTQPHPHMDNSEGSAIGCSGSRADKGIYGGGQGSGSTYIGFRKIFLFPGLPFSILVPQISTWGEGGGYGGANDKPGTGATCQCTHNGFPIHYVLNPFYILPTGPTSLNSMRRDAPADVAPGPSHN